MAGSLTRARFMNPKPQVAHLLNSKPNEYLPNRAAGRTKQEDKVFSVRHDTLGNIVINTQYLLVVVVFTVHPGCLFSVSQRICHLPATDG